MRSSRPLLPALLFLGLGLAFGGCQSRQARKGPPGKAATVAVATTATATATTPATAAGGDALHGVTDARYISFVRPLLTRRGCDADACHSVEKNGGFFFATVSTTHFGDYQRILERIDRKHPEDSILFKKALGRVEHNGGKNLADDECDTRRLLAWIGEKPDPDCQKPPPPRTPERFVREVAPALVKLGCAAATCHGAPAVAGQPRRFDLSSLTAATPRPESAAAVFDGSGLNHRVVWVSPVIKAALAEDGLPAHKAKADQESCAYRRVYGYIAQAPESECDLGGDAGPSLKTAARWPSLGEFTSVVMPQVERRGCVASSCHGGGAGDMTLFDIVSSDRHAAVHDYINLTARVEDLAKPEESTLMRTVRNQEPHGGGKRLGGKGDCLDRLMTTWLYRRPVHACPPPEPPSFARFVSEIQPVLEKMTCTQLGCHGKELPIYRVTAHPDRKGIESNYRETLKFIDLDYTPFSGILLRMREPCAYPTVSAWIEGKPRPHCTVHDPDPNIFPKRDNRGRIIHTLGPPPGPPQKT